MGFIQASHSIPASIGDVYRHITDLTHAPDWVAGHFEIDLPAEIPILREGVEFEIATKRFGLKRIARFRVDELKVRSRVSYRQLSGVFKHWVHTQTLVKHGPKLTILSDHVEYKLGLGILGALADDIIVRHDLEKILSDRAAAISALFSNSPDDGERST
jgi:ligand-binding SRPBCC domain-containing protein